MFVALSAFKMRHRHCNVPRDHAEYSELASWVNNQRSRKERLTPEQVGRLDAIGFNWDTLASQREIMFASLSLFKKKHGHCNVPATYQGNPILGTWVSNQRTRYGRLTRKQIERLEVLGFDWDPRATQWEQTFEALREFHEKHGHCNVPKESYVGNPSLGRWVANQRTARKINRLAREQIERLDALGFDWGRHASRWEEMFMALCSFRRKQGHCNVPAVYMAYPRLSKWVRQQRMLHKNNKLTSERVRRLKALDFK